MKLRLSLVFAGLILLLSVSSLIISPVLSDGYKIIVPSSEYEFDFEERESYRAFTVFIGGDVETEGFFEVPAGITYFELFALSDFREKSGYNLSDKVSINTTVLLSGDCCNINYADYDYLLFYIADAAIARAVADYIAESGGTNNKYDLVETGILTYEQFDLIKNRIYALIQ